MHKFEVAQVQTTRWKSKIKYKFPNRVLVREGRRSGFAGWGWSGSLLQWLPYVRLYNNALQGASRFLAVNIIMPILLHSLFTRFHTSTPCIWEMHGNIFPLSVQKKDRTKVSLLFFHFFCLYFPRFAYCVCVISHYSIANSISVNLQYVYNALTCIILQ